jgi:hypothetical protein
MSTKMTDRIAIEKALQRAETQKIQKIPSNVIRLSSNGKIYPTTHPLAVGTIELRYMTAYDEDILTNTSYIKENIVFEKLLDALIMTPGIGIDDVAQNDRDILIIHARIMAYGSKYPVTVTKPNTNITLSRDIDLSKLVSKPFTLSSDENGEFVYSFNDLQSNNLVELKFRYLVTEPYETISDYLNLIITEVNGNRDPEYILEYIQYQFLAGDAKTFRKYVADNAPGLDTMYEFEDDNGGIFQSTFRFDIDLFWF